MTTKRFLSLDGLRGVCALSVLLYHSGNFFCSGAAFKHGFLAVDVFFILSGFVIALTYEEKLKSGDQALHFLSNRARRLFPTYWLGAIVNVAVFLGIAISGILFSGDSWWMVWLFIPIATFLMIPDYITPDGTLYPGMEGVTWSLFLEWIAYASYASGVFRWKTSTLLTVCVCGWSLMTLVGYHTGEGWSAGGTRETFFTVGLLRCLSAFAAGIVIYRIHTHERFQRLPVVATNLLLATWLVMAALPAHGPTPALDSIVVISCPILIALLIRSDHGAPRFCKRLGELSYPLYVVHPGIILLAHRTSIFGRFDKPNPLNGLLVDGLCLGCAWVIAEITASISRGRKVRASNWNVADKRTAAHPAL